MCYHVRAVANFLNMDAEFLVISCLFCLWGGLVESTVLMLTATWSAPRVWTRRTAPDSAHSWRDQLQPHSPHSYTQDGAASPRCACSHVFDKVSVFWTSVVVTWDSLVVMWYWSPYPMVRSLQHSSSTFSLSRYPWRRINLFPSQQPLSQNFH